MHRQQANILVSSDHGTMIVNRFDYRMSDEKSGIGVGWQLMNSGQYDWKEVELLKLALKHRLKSYGDGVVAIDCGANIGVHTIEWARLLNDRGAVLSLEPQEHVFYALCGNIAINNCFNVKALNFAAGDANTLIEIPKPNYFSPSSFGSLELRQGSYSENIGQDLVDSAKVEQIALDSLQLSRLDLLKIDVEGWNLRLLQARSKPSANTNPKC